MEVDGGVVGRRHCPMCHRGFVDPEPVGGRCPQCDRRVEDGPPSRARMVRPDVVFQGTVYHYDTAEPPYVVDDDTWSTITTLSDDDELRPRAASAPPHRPQPARPPPRAFKEIHTRDKRSLEELLALRERDLDMRDGLSRVVQTLLVDGVQRQQPAPDVVTLRTLENALKKLKDIGVLRTPQPLLSRGWSGCLVTWLKFVLSKGKTCIKGPESRQDFANFEMAINSVIFYLLIPPEVVPHRGAGSGVPNRAIPVLLYTPRVPEDRDRTLRRCAIYASRPTPSLSLEVSATVDALTKHRRVEVACADPSGGILPGEFDMIYVAGHFGERGVPDPAALVPEHGRPPQLVVLNSCATQEVAMRLYQRRVRFVVCWESLVPDDVAAVFGHEFVQLLAELEGPLDVTIKQAFQSAAARAALSAEPSPKGAAGGGESAATPRVPEPAAGATGAVQVVEDVEAGEAARAAEDPEVQVVEDLEAGEAIQAAEELEAREAVQAVEAMQIAEDLEAIDAAAATRILVAELEAREAEEAADRALAIQISEDIDAQEDDAERGCRAVAGLVAGLAAAAAARDRDRGRGGRSRSPRRAATWLC